MRVCTCMSGVWCARFEYSWWGNELYIYSFDGVVLPSWEGGALQVRDLKGDVTTIENLIVKTQCKVPQKHTHAAPVCRCHN